MKLWSCLPLVLATALLVPAGGCLRTDSQSVPPAGQSPGGELELKVAGPERAKIGDTVTFELTVTNHGRAPAAGLFARVGFDEGLQHEVGPSPIEHDLPDLAPGETQHANVAFRVTRSGRLVVTVEVERVSRSVLATSQTAVESAGAASR